MLYILATVATNLPLRNLEKNHYLALKYVFSWKLRPNCIFLKVAVPYTSQWATILLFHFCSAIYLPLGHWIFSQCHILTIEPPLQCHIMRPSEVFETIGNTLIIWRISKNVEVEHYKISYTKVSSQSSFQMSYWYTNFCWCRCGSSLPGMRTLDPPLRPPLTPTEMFGV